MGIYQSDLLAASARGFQKQARSITEARNVGLRTAFLCHSHHDRSLAVGLINLLAEKGLQLYVDWADTEMPETPNRETADRIRTKIRDLDLFFFLATANSMQSRWCPWELGYADGQKPPERIILIQTAERMGSWYGNEYLGLYRRLEPTDSNSLAVFGSGMSNGGTLVRNL